jgi:hypothetical protein
MSPSFFIILVVLAGLALGVALIYFSYLTEKKRTEDLKQVAQDLGFEFWPQGDAALFKSLNRFHLFSLGYSNRLWNLLRGKANDLEVNIFDYRYVTGAGKHKHALTQSVVCFRFTGSGLPTFSLRPENVWHKIGSWLGYQDIDFGSHPSFSSHYLLRGGDENAIRALFTDPMLTFYEQHPGLSTEGSGNLLLFYRNAGKVGPQGVRAFMEEGFKVLSQFRSVA